MMKRMATLLLVFAMLCLSVPTAAMAQEVFIGEETYVSEWAEDGTATFEVTVFETDTYIFWFDCVDRGVISTPDGDVLAEDAMQLEVMLEAKTIYIVTLYANEYGEEGCVYFERKIPVTDIELFGGKDTVWASLGETVNLQYEQLPSDASFEDVTAMVADTSVALAMGTEVRAVGVGKTTVTLTSESGASDSVTLIVKPAIAFDGEGTQTVAITPQHTSHTFALKVKESGNYLLFTESESDTVGSLYSQKLLYITGGDDGFDSDTDFCFEAELWAGKTYYLNVATWGLTPSLGEVDVTVCKMDGALEAFDVYPDSVTLSVGDWWAPYYAIDKADSTDFADATDYDVVTVGWGVNVMATAVGTAAVTFSTASGMTDTVEVTVVDTPSLTLGEAVTVSESVDACRECAHTFTAPADGTYCFKTVGLYSWLYLFDEENGELEAAKCCETDSGACLSLEMAAGQTLTVYSSDAYGDNYQLVVLDETTAPQSVSLEVYEGSSLLEKDGVSVFYAGTDVPLQVLYDDIVTTAFEAYTLTADAEGVYTYDNVVYGEAAGTYTVTLTTDSGLTDSVTLTFIDAVAGDINFDGKLTVADAVQLYYHVNGKTQLPEQSLPFSDYSGDNQLTITDAVQLYYKVNGK